MSINSGLKLCIGNFIPGHNFHFFADTRSSRKNPSSADYLNFAGRFLPLQFRFHETPDVRTDRARRGIRWVVLLESFSTNFERASKRASASGNNFSGTHARFHPNPR
jgi:hypothetical protein